MNALELKEKVLNGYNITKDDAMNLVDMPLDELVAAADEIRSFFCGNKFDVCTLINVKNGRCSEDCKFCAQSNHYDTDIDIYPFLSEEELLKQSNSQRQFSIFENSQNNMNINIRKIILIYNLFKYNFFLNQL